MSLITDPLVGLEWDEAHQNCYTLLREFYRINANHIMGDYPNPKGWERTDLDLYRELAHVEGFLPITDPPLSWKVGDVIIMALNSRLGNHAGILVENGRMLHHLHGHRSSVCLYGGVFRNNTVAVYRHPEVSFPLTDRTVAMEKILPSHVRTRLENYFAHRGTEQ